MRHIENLANMAKQGLFVYKGRGNKADATFVLGRVRDGRPARPRCIGSVKRNGKFAYGICTLPYYPDVPGAPQNTVIGGASLWVMAGKKPEEYKGVAAVLQLPVASPKSQPRATSAPATCRSPWPRSS